MRKSMLSIFRKMIRRITSNTLPPIIDKVSTMGDFVKLFTGKHTY